MEIFTTILRWFDLGWMPGAHQAALSLRPSSAGQGRENTMKSSWVEIRTGRDHSATTAMGKTASTWEN